MKRKIVNTALAVSSSLTALSGLFLLFHYQSYFTKVLHELAGLIFLVFGLWHFKLNLSALRFLRGSRGMLVVAFLVTCLVIMALTGDYYDENLSAANLN